MTAQRTIIENLQAKQRAWAYQAKGGKIAGRHIEDIAIVYKQRKNQTNAATHKTASGMVSACVNAIKRIRQIIPAGGGMAICLAAVKS